MKHIAKGIADAIAAFGANKPALDKIAPVHPARPASPADASDRVASSDAISAAIDACGLALHDVEAVEWHLDESNNTYVVTFSTSENVERTVYVDAATGDAHMAIESSDAIGKAVDASGLTWHDVTGVEWSLNDAHDFVVTLSTNTGSRSVVVDAATGAARMAK